MTTQDYSFPEHRGFTSAVEQGVTRPVPQGFSTEDILWTLGIWSVILCLSPVIVFYMLMVA